MLALLYVQNVREAFIPGRWVNRTTDPPGDPWTEYVVGSAWGLRRMLLGYRDGAKVFSGTYLTDDSLFE